LRCGHKPSGWVRVKETASSELESMKVFLAIFIGIAVLLVLMPTISSLSEYFYKYPHLIKDPDGGIMVVRNAVVASNYKKLHCPLRDKYFRNEDEKDARLLWKQYCAISDYIVDHGGDIELLCTMTPYC
jgi:hypothetical protein